MSPGMVINHVARSLNNLAIHVQHAHNLWMILNREDGQRLRIGMNESRL